MYQLSVRKVLTVDILCHVNNKCCEKKTWIGASLSADIDGWFRLCSCGRPTTFSDSTAIKKTYINIVRINVIRIKSIGPIIRINVANRQ